MSLQSSKFVVANTSRYGIDERIELRATLDEAKVENERLGHFCFELSGEMNVCFLKRFFL